MHSTPDITFIGGGITGLLSARLFALTGASVTIIEQNNIGQESSWAGGGILLPLYPWRQADAITQLILPSIATYAELAATLLATTQVDPEYIPCGLLMTDLPDLAQAQDWCIHAAIQHHTATPAQRATFPQIQAQSLWLPEIAQARNPRLLKALKQDLIQRGVKIIENCTIDKANIHSQRITEVMSQSNEVFAVNQLVITAGAWTGKLWTQLLGHAVSPVDVFPVKGQMLIFDTPLGTLDYMVLEHDRYLIPRRDGKILCGSTVEQQGFDKLTTVQAKQSLAEFAKQILPILADCPITHHWAGLRPGTKQGIPYIDKHPEISNLAVSAGHFRNGFAMGPASAQLLYDLITNNPPLIDSTAYQLSAQH